MTADASTDRKLELAVHKRVLDNGLTCLAVQTHAAPTVAICCSVDVSLMHEDKDKAGLALLLGSCLEEGTKKRTGDELAELVEGYGGYLSCSSSGATVQFAAEDVSVAADILAEVLLEPSLPADGLRRVKELTLADISADLDDPRTVASEAFRKNVYGAHPLGRVAKGTVESVQGLERADLSGFHATWYKPRNAVCAAVGAVEPESLLDLIEKTPA